MNPVPKSLVVMREKLKALRRRWLRVKIAENLVGFWLAYGIFLRLNQVILWNAIGIILVGLLMYAKLKYGR